MHLVQKRNDISAHFLMRRSTLFPALLPRTIAALLRRNILRGTVLNRTYGTHKNLPGIYIYLLFVAVCGPIYYGPP